MELQSLNPFGKATAECGFSLANGTARDLPAQVQWKDFGYSHQGPCEVWCDDKLAFMDTNCALHYPEVPASLPYDVDVCSGAKMIQSYWIALHGLPWQLYLNCVPLTGEVNGTANALAGESDSEQNPPATTDTTTSTTTTTEAPTAATEAPFTSADTHVTTTDAPEAATPEVTPATPIVTTATSTATKTISQTDTGAKCSRRRT
ncbi:unnamed protein product [Phytophthora lilii]|uniref:Unnamed protein product n=1 Tax=Phytophthora lilii TaxID=2077276 RepID=A0A9W6YIW7_9STRA|nr:unnamed protein product [Phytophthora lilii]